MFRCSAVKIMTSSLVAQQSKPHRPVSIHYNSRLFFFLPCQIILFQDMELFSEPILPPSSLTECRVALRYWQPPHLLHNNVPLKRRISPKSLNTLLTPACCYLYILGWGWKPLRIPIGLNPPLITPCQLNLSIVIMQKGGERGMRSVSVFVYMPGWCGLQKKTKTKHWWNFSIKSSLRLASAGWTEGIWTRWH